jgi:hypothetical protein
VRSYLSDPIKSFGLNHRQAAKLESGLVKTETLLRTNRRSAIEFLMSAGRLRARYAEPTVYIQNIGSSGSHWLKTMLGRALHIFPGGEIYFPRAFLDRIRGMEKFIAREALQTIYLAHVFDDRPNIVTASLTNTAHIARIEKYARYDAPALKLLLIRDPVEIVLSRTFRKDEFRNYLGCSGFSDEEYLSINMRRVVEFFKQVMLENHHYICRYEDIVRSPFDVLKELSGVLQIAYEERSLWDAIESTRANGGALQTNAFQGERRPIPEHLRSLVETELRPLREQLGYTIGEHCEGNVLLPANCPPAKAGATLPLRPSGR